MKLLIIGILLVIFVVSLVKYRKDLAVYEKKLVKAMRNSQVFETDKYRVQYEVRGNGIPVLVSHGITGGLDQGKGMVETYLNPNYQYIYVSRFGYLGSSMPEDPSVQHQATAYQQLLNFLEIDRVWVYANSAGGTSALQFAIDYPEKTWGLILQSSNMPGEYPALPPKPVIEVVFGNSYIYWCSMRLFGEQMLKTFMTIDIYEGLKSSEKHTLLNNVLLSSLPIAKRKKGIIFDMFSSNVYINELKISKDKLSMPILIVHADDDPSIPIEYARNFAKKIEAELLEVKGGHLMIDSELTVKSSVDKFINKSKNK